MFDRDSRVGDDFAKSALRLGAVFASSPSLATDDTLHAGATLTPALSSVLPNGGVFPKTTIEPAAEPSNLVVAADVMSEPASLVPVAAESRLSLPEGLVPSRRRRGAWALVAGAAVLAVVSTIAISKKQLEHTRVTTAVAVKSEPAPAAPPPAEPGPVLELDEPSPPAPVAAQAPTGPSAPSADPAKTTDPKNRFGRFTIKSDPKVKNVWFDGKRMLGSGTRSFLVFCGMHTVAVNEKTEQKDIEIPCNGEYVAQR